MLRWFGIALAGLLALVAVPASAETPVTQPCELHVWGAGRPNFKPKPNFLVRLNVDPAEQDLSNPLSNASLYSTINRTKAFPDTTLRELFPAGTPVTIVRHDTIVDIDKTPIKSLKHRLADSAAPCYADLVLANIYAIFPNPDFQGLLVDAIDGGNRLVLDLWLFGRSAGAKPWVFRKRNDAPLLSFRADRPLFAQSVQLASTTVLEAFAKAAQAKRPK